MPTINNETKIKRIYIKDGFSKESVGYNIGMDAVNVEYDNNGTEVDLQGILEEHFGSMVFSEAGAHGIRYYDKKLSVWDGTKWYEIPIGGDIGLDLDPVSAEGISFLKHTATISWTDPADILIDGEHAIVKWAGTRIIRRTDRSPDPNNGEDGQIIYEEERDEDLPNQGRNRHTTEADGYKDNNLNFGQTYFYGIYSYKKLSNGDKVFSKGKIVYGIPTPVVINTIPYQNNILNYTGEEQYPTFGGTSDPDMFIKSGTLKGTNGRLSNNPYKAIFTPTADYVWAPALVEDNDREPKEVSWYINPIQVSTPEVTNTNLTYTRENGDGKEQGPTIEDYDHTQINITNTIGKDAKEYNMKLSLINPSEIDTNYVWTNGSREDQIINWIINRRELVKPRAETIEFIYTGETIELTLQDFDENYMTKEGTSGIDADNYNASFNLLGNIIDSEHPEQNQINCCWVGGSIITYVFAWTISAKYIDRPRVTKDLVYDGTEQNISEYLIYDEEYSKIDNPENLKGINAKDYVLTFSLDQPANKKNLKWKDAGDYPFTPKNLTWHILKAPNENWTLNFSYKNGMLPYKFYRGSSVIYDGKIHILGGNLSGTTTNHYSYDGIQWKKESVLPYDFSLGGAIATDKKIYIFGSDATTVIPGISLARSKACYSWDPINGWSQEPELPYDFIGGCAIYYDNKAYIIGGGTGTNGSSNVWSWDFNSENSWTQEANYVQSFKGGTAVVYNDKIYVMGGNSSSTAATSQKIAYYDKTTETWTTVTGFLTGAKMQNGSQISIDYNGRIYLFLPSTIKSWGFGETSWKIETSDIPPYGTNAPYMTYFYGGNIIVLDKGGNKEIHLLGGSTNSTVSETTVTQYHYNGVLLDNNLKWDLENLAPPYKLINGCSVVYHNKIHILGGGSAGNKNHYSFNGKTWDKESTLPYDFYNGCAIVYNDKIYIIGGSGSGNVSNISQTVAINRACFSWPNEGETPWKLEPILPNRFYNGSSFVYDNKLFIVGGGTTKDYTEQRRLQYLDTEQEEWTTVIDAGGSQINVPTNFVNNIATVYNNKIYLIFSQTIYSSDLTDQFKPITTGSLTTTTGGQAFEYNNRLHILGGTGGTTKHCSIFTGPVIAESTLPESLNKGCAVIYQNKIILIGNEDLYVYNNNSATWNSYGSINFDTVTQEVFFNNLIEIEDNLSDGKVTFSTSEEEEFKMENYCEIIKNPDENTFYFKLNNTLFETSELYGIKTVNATIQIGESQNYQASRKKIPLNIIGIEVSDNTKWNNIKDKQLEAMIKAKDYENNDGEHLKVLNPENPQQKIPFDLQKYWSIGSISDFKTIPHLGGSNFKSATFNANSVHRWVILDFIDIQTSEENTTPVMVIGMLGCLSSGKSSTTASLAWPINNAAGSETYPANAPWLQSGAKATCDNFYKVFQLSFLIKERYNIGKIFLPSEKEIVGDVSQGADDGTSQFAYFAIEGNSKKYAGTNCSRELTNGYWTRTPSRLYPQNYSFANSNGEVSAAVNSAENNKGYSFITCI